MDEKRQTILILEDSDVRLELMSEALEACPRRFTIQRFDNVREMRAKAKLWTSCVCLISLDFDLSNSRAGDPGTGLDAVQLLASMPAVCPVIVHTSLAEAGRVMAETLRAHGWTVREVRLNRREAVSNWRDMVEALAG